MSAPGMPTPPAGVPSWLQWATYIIAQVGFPIAVAAYLLGSMQGTIDKLTAAVNTNSALLASLAEKLAR